MKQIESDDIQHLRDLARRGESAATMFRDLKSRLGSSAHIADLLDGFRRAFCLTLAEAKPVAAFTRTADRDIIDEDEFNRYVMPEIVKHRHEWDQRKEPDD
jgi:hypothetical protein